jgi:hypothetical protein
VRAYDVGHDAGHVYIAYEYVPGRTVREALRSDAVSDLEAVEIAAQVLDALAHAHRTGIVHRDVKPSNILLEHSDEISVRLLDFGLAQFDGADTLTAVGDVPGTLAYIAPERLAGADAAPASDVWAVGVLLWESLSGRHPFWGMPLQEVALAIERGAPPLVDQRPDLPRRLLAAVSSALEAEPAERPHASALAGELRLAVRPEPTRAAPRRAPRTRVTHAVPAAPLVARLAPAVLAAATAAVGVTLLPFWPASLALAIVAGAAAAALRNPRAGAAIALAAPVFPLGNYAQGAAVLYSAFAVAWLALFWREARLGLLFVVGPFLAAFGALALVPLAVQPMPGAVRRAAQAAVAMLSAMLVATLADDPLPVGSGVGPLDIGPGDSAQSIAFALSSTLLQNPVLLAAALVAALAAALLPWARRSSPYGVGTVGVVLVACAIAAGAGIAATLLLVTVWGAAAVLAARAGR